MSHDHADVSVRPGSPTDAGEIGRIHVAAWRAAHRENLGASIVDAFEPADFAAAWRTGMEEHPSGTDGRFMLIACQGPHTVGFAALTPAADPDAEPGDTELSALYVDPASGYKGHGSRLLAAVVDTARAAGLSRIFTWVLDGDLARESFLASAGIAADGAWRELEIVPGRVIVERRWQAGIQQEPSV